MFKAILINKNESGQQACLTDIEETALPDGDVLVEVLYSSLNYKDALAITGKSPIVRKFPMIPGIDFVGTIVDSQHPELTVGMSVVLNGWGLGEVHWGGMAQKARLNGDWLVPLPDKLSAKQSMAIGTAGYTLSLIHI